MLILGQKSCILGPTIFKIPQPNWYYFLYHEWNPDFAINYSNGQSNTSIKLDYIRLMNQRSI